MLVDELAGIKQVVSLAHLIGTPSTADTEFELLPHSYDDYEGNKDCELTQSYIPY